jgi:hypothetical protein
VQHGFRRTRSTTTALTQFSDDINDKLNKKLYVGILFIDFKKAFDTLDHELLLGAMEECGIRGPTSQWFRSYLTSRTLRTKVNDCTGEEAPIKYGVPTGSVYGPVGYIMHVNSISNVVEHCSTYMYADDTCLVYADQDVTLIEARLQSDFNSLLKWSHDNGILLNSSKTKYMLVKSPYIKRQAGPIRIVGHSYECLHSDMVLCTCQSLEFVDTYKYLGLKIDSNFNWKPHVEGVCNKLRSILCKLKNVSYFTDKATLHTLYHALADSVLSYGLTVYGGTFKTQLDKILNLQLRLVKTIVKKKTRENCNKHYNILFQKCNILPVHEKFKFLLAVNQYKCTEFKTMKVYPPSLRTLSTKRKKYIEPSANNYYGKRARNYLIPRIYNNIPSEDDCVSLPVFKKKVKRYMLEKYILNLS